jgi:hypothetical protein
MPIPMKQLRTVLSLHAAMWTASGFAVASAPGWVLVTVFDQARNLELTFVRISGVLAVALALMMVLVAQKEDVWWWSWAFVLETGLTALVTTLHAIGSVPAGSASWFWWIFAITNIVLAAMLVSGIGRAGTEKPIV